MKFIFSLMMTLLLFCGVSLALGTGLDPGVSKTEFSFVQDQSDQMLAEANIIMDLYLDFVFECESDPVATFLEPKYAETPEVVFIGYSVTMVSVIFNSPISTLQYGSDILYMHPDNNLKL